MARPCRSSPEPDLAIRISNLVVFARDHTCRRCRLEAGYAASVELGAVMTERFEIKREIAIIPPWAFVFAAIIFICVQVVFAAMVWTHADETPPLAVRVLIP